MAECERGHELIRTPHGTMQCVECLTMPKAESPLSEALAQLVRQGDMGEVRRFLYLLRQAEYIMAHDVRQSGAHMAPGCLTLTCAAFPTFEEWDKAG
jgi:hypothetical protein